MSSPPDISQDKIDIVMILKYKDHLIFISHVKHTAKYHE